VHPRALDPNSRRLFRGSARHLRHSKQVAVGACVRHADNLSCLSEPSMRTCDAARRRTALLGSGSARRAATAANHIPRQALRRSQPVQNRVAGSIAMSRVMARNTRLRRMCPMSVHRGPCAAGRTGRDCLVEHSVAEAGRVRGDRVDERVRAHRLPVKMISRPRHAGRRTRDAPARESRAHLDQSTPSGHAGA